MKTFQSFGALARTLERCVIKMEVELAGAMEASAVLVEAAAKAEIGHYQRDDMGPFKPWDELKKETKQGRVRQGWTANDPLLRSGEMRDSIEHTSSKKSFVVGSNSPLMVYQELGTSRGIPPRPVLSLALYRSTPAILKIIGKTIETTLADKT